MRLSIKVTHYNSSGYCPYCQQFVPLKREDMNAPLAILLFIFTAGVGFFIYLLVYFLNSKDRCVYCGSFVQFNIPQRCVECYSQTQTHYQQQVYTQPTQNYVQVVEKSPPPEISEGSNKTPKFCFSCGKKFNGKGYFCDRCGAKLI